MARPEENGVPKGQIELSRLNSSAWRHENNDRDDTDADPDHYLPLLADWNSWWSVVVHTVTATVAVGVLALPTTMGYLGWWGGAIVLVGSWVITLFTVWQMVEMHEMVPGERNETYHKLGQKAFGNTLGLWLVLPQQLIVQIGSNVVYMIGGGQAFWQCYQLLHCEGTLDPMAIRDGQCCGNLGPAAFILFFSVPQFFIAQLGDYDSIVSVSLAASVTCICYCTIAWIEAVSKGITNHSKFPPGPGPTCLANYDLPVGTTASQVFGAFGALGVVAFTYSSHNVVLEIQTTLPSTRIRPSKIDMWRGLKVAYAIVAICYFPVAFAGYWAFGSQGPNLGAPFAGRGNILLQLGTPRWLIAAADLMLAIHLTGSYQVYAVPVFDMMEKALVRKFPFRFNTPAPRSLSVMRIVIRTTYVFFTAFLACTFPFFTDIISFLGGFAFTPSTYFLPCMIWLKLKGRESSRAVWLINWSLIVIGVLLSIAGTIGGIRSVIVDASKYHKYIYRFTCESSNATTCRHVHF